MTKYIRIRGLPWSSSKKKISDFFLPVEIPDLDICIIKSASGRDTGEALLKLSSAEDFDKCMEKHKEYLGTRYLELFEATVGEWTRITGVTERLPNAPASEKSSVLLLRGLPYGAAEDDIRDFFEGIDIVAVYLIKDHMGRASGHAYVELESEALLEEALQKDKQYIDDRYIELFKSAIPDLMKALRKSQQNQDQIQNYFRLQPGHYAQPNPMFGSSQVQKPFCIRMRGMPYNTTESIIISFFKEVKITPSRIHRKADGSEAYIEFRTSQERDVAMTRQRAFIGNRYVDIFVCDYDVIAARITAPPSSMYGNSVLAAASHAYSPHGRSLYPHHPSYPTSSVLDPPYPRAPAARYPAQYGGLHQPPSYPKGYYGGKLGYPPSAIYEDPAAIYEEPPYYGF